jgi:parvulin-like peptidyl-prolyl isomerase
MIWALATVLASWHGMPITLADATREETLRSRDEAQFREVQGHDLERSRSDVLRRFALRHALGAPGDDPVLEAKARGFARDWFLGVWASRNYDLPSAAVDREVVRRELAASLPSLPQRWKVSHILLAATSPTEQAAAVAKLTSLRALVHNADDFARLAREYSQSQTARRDGRLGTVRPGWLRPAAEAAVAALAPGAVSEPVVVDGGVHLFYLHESHPPGQDLSEARLDRAVREREATVRLEARRQRLAAAPSVPSPSAAVLAALASTPERQAAWLEAERLLAAAGALGVVLPTEQARLVDLAADVRLRARLNGQAAATVVHPTATEVAQRFQSDPNAWRRPEHLAAEVLRVAIDRNTDPREQLEGLIELTGEGDLAAAAVALGVTLERVDLLPGLEVAGALGPLVFDATKGLATGRVSAPIQDDGDLVVVRYTTREPGRLLSPQEAAPLVTEALLAERRKLATGTLSGSIVRDLELTAEGIAWTRGGTP